METMDMAINGAIEAAGRQAMASMALWAIVAVILLTVSWAAAAGITRRAR